MVFISRQQRDFNDDMGAYLDNRNSGADAPSSFFSRVDSLIPRRKRSSQDDVPELSGSVESIVYEDGSDSSTFFSKILSLFNFSSRSRDEIEEEFDDLPDEVKPEIREIEAELEELDEEVDEIEEKRENLITRFFNLFRSSNSYDEDEDLEFEHSDTVELDSNEVLKAETRQTLKIIHKWISRLSPDQINAFKRSPDFQRYKDLLDKYGLLK